MQESEILSIKYLFFFYNPHIFEFTISDGAYLYLYTLIVEIHFCMSIVKLHPQVCYLLNTLVVKIVNSKITSAGVLLIRFQIFVVDNCNKKSQ